LLARAEIVRRARLRAGGLRKGYRDRRRRPPAHRSPDHQRCSARGTRAGFPAARERRRGPEDPGELFVKALDLFKLDGKTALVTGCRRGIGKAMALALAEAGADIIAVSKSLEPKGSVIEREVTALGRNFKGYRCDMASRGSVLDFLADANNDLAAIDILVDNP